MTELEDDTPVTQVQYLMFRATIWEPKLHVFNLSCVFYASVIMTACNYQPVHIWKGM